MITSGALVILPESPAIDLKKGEEPSLGELRSTKVVDLGFAPQLYDLVVSHYKHGRQVAVLPSMYVPWIKNVDIEDILHIRQDSQKELIRFQEGYHESLIYYMERYEQVDFEKMSTEIYRGEIEPELNLLQKKYEGILSHNKKLHSIGTLSVLPITAAIVSETVFHYTIGSIPSMIASVTASVLSALAGYGIAKHKASKALELEGNKYYIVWKLEQ